MSPDVLQVLGRVQVELGYELEAFEQHSATYARRLLASVENGSRNWPARPTAMHPLIAKAIREIVIDEAQALRTLPVRHRR